MAVARSLGAMGFTFAFGFFWYAITALETALRASALAGELRQEVEEEDVEIRSSFALSDIVCEETGLGFKRGVGSVLVGLRF
mmetsp:Transcript_23191/g.41090  ORF Transcript_23191/g.41090 Transcript_23191/m.41090 type:complete len:82 (+) Transcript_23191:2933-3178(+)